MRKTYNIIVPKALGERLEAQAEKREMPYQVFCRILLSKAEKDLNRKHSKQIERE